MSKTTVQALGAWLDRLIRASRFRGPGQGYYSGACKALVETFGAVDGLALWNRFTVHYTPKHASWLDQAEIEIGIYSKQCLGTRRIGSLQELRTETAAWNRAKLTIDWGFTVRAARKKFGYSRRRGKINLSGN